MVVWAGGRTLVMLFGPWNMPFVVPCSPGAGTCDLFAFTTYFICPGGGGAAPLLRLVSMFALLHSLPSQVLATDLPLPRHS